VTFEYVADRQDWATAPYRLADIKIFDRLSNTLIREIDFNNNSYFGSPSYNYTGPDGSYQDNSARLRLDGITIKGSDGVADQQYAFTYNDGNIPYNSFSRFNDHKRMYFDEDYWGYYNGANNGGLIPSEFLETGLPGGVTWGGVRRANPSYANVFMLQSIRYPTGGTTSFTFEPNYSDEAFTSAGDYVGGFRVKTITAKADAISQPVEKSYEYFDGKVEHTIDRDMFVVSQTYDWDFDACTGNLGPAFFGRSTFQSSSFCPVTLTNGASIIYPHVIEYNGVAGLNGQGNTVNTGKTEYFYDFTQDCPTGTAMPEPFTMHYGAYWFDNGSYSPQLSSKVVYKNENGTFTPVSETNNTYQIFRDKTYSTGVNVLKTSYDINISTGAYVNNGYLIGSSCPNSGLNQYPYHWQYTDGIASERVSLLTSSTEKFYDANGVNTLSNTKVYTYGNLDHLQPTQISTTSSKGDQLSTSYQYPQDNTTDNFASLLTQYHILTPVIEQRNYKNSSFLQSVKAYYNSSPGINGTPIIAPSYITTQLGTNPADARIQYKQYDNLGNLLDVSKTDNEDVVYFYGYNAALPVAKVTGTNYNTAAQYVDQSVLNSPSSDQVMRDQLNNLRLHLPNALVTSYTYAPLVGVTSETDPRGKTTYYEYDPMGRLKLVRDLNNNIVKKICYNYAGQPEACFSGVFYNYPLTATISKNNNCTGAITQWINYTVPAGKYSSTINQRDADQQATNDRNSIGQAQANQLPCKWANAERYVSYTPQSCPLGYSAPSVGYDVKTGKYLSVINQDDADQLANNDQQANGQTYANQYALQHNTCVPNGVFVTISRENFFTTYNGPFPSGQENREYNQFGDIVARFYQDVNCTIPVDVSNLNLTVVIQEISFDNDALVTTTTYPSKVVSGTSTVILPAVLIEGLVGGHFVENTFSLMAGSGYVPAN
jgi:YD repeat-containing protein